MNLSKRAWILGVRVPDNQTFRLKTLYCSLLSIGRSAARTLPTVFTGKQRSPLATFRSRSLQQAVQWTLFQWGSKVSTNWSNTWKHACYCAVMYTFTEKHVCFHVISLFSAHFCPHWKRVSTTEHVRAKALPPLPPCRCCVSMPTSSRPSTSHRRSTTV